MIILHRSNRMERLADALATLVAQPPPGTDPLQPETIVVQSRGMERFLSMHLSRRLGVWANPCFPFPRAFLQTAFDAVLGPHADADAEPFSREALRWTLAARLPQHLSSPAFAQIRDYLAGDDGGDMRMQLCERLAALFDDYLVYRPRPDDFIARWQRGQRAEDEFQAVLFRDLVATLGDGHVATRTRELIAALAPGSTADPQLPPRVFLFGIASLPPLYLHAFEALGQVLQVHVFSLSPSQEYWGDIRRRRGMAPEPPEAAPDHIEEGHPLLASLGQVGKDFHRLLEEGGGYVEGQTGIAAYDDPGTGDVLHALQSDILHLRTRGGEAGPPRLTVAPDDRSIAIHACHGPMREVEVLHDQLAAIFDTTDVQPHEVIVMAPDIETYAPLIEAVFGETTGRPRIPFRVSDRPTRTTHALVDAFDAVLEALSGRVTAGEVLDLLSREAVRTRFDIADESLPQLRTWVAESGLRWGVDADHRAEVGQPALADHTFRFGLDRLWLGYATGDTGTATFAGRLPLADFDAGDAQLLGRFGKFCETLFACRRKLLGTRDVTAWRDVLLEVMDATLSATGTLGEQQQLVRDALLALSTGAQGAGFDGALSLRAMRRLLEQQIEAGNAPRGFLTGGVTFCQLVPMRSIPFRVVCLLGMNDEDYPRRQPRLGFDLIASAPARPGDRNPAAEDRYLFLEALLSARERLLITYAGRGVNDNAVRPPSVLVGELVGVLARSCVFPAEASGASSTAAAEAHLVVTHRLQPFSPAYFGADTDPRLFSYAAQFFEGAQSLSHARAARVFVPEPLPQLEEAPTEIELQALSRFIERPVQRFLQLRLGLYLHEEHVALDAREPVSLDALASWRVGDRLLELAHDGVAPADAWASMRASGQLPPGTPGQLVFEELLPGIDALSNAARAHTAGAAPAPPLPFALDIDGLTLHGALRALYPDAQVHLQFSRVGGRQELRLWVAHLVLQVLRQRGDAVPAQTVLIGRADGGAGATGVVRFGSVDEPLEQLRTLLDCYRAGLRYPLPFEHGSALEYVRARRKGTDESGALAAARKAYEGDFSDGRRAELRRVYPSFDALLAAQVDGHDFVGLAHAVLGPLRAHREVV